MFTLLEYANRLPIVCVEGIRQGYYINILYLKEDPDVYDVGDGEFPTGLLSLVAALKSGAQRKRSINIPYSSDNGGMLFYNDNSTIVGSIKNQTRLEITKKNTFSEQDLKDIVNAIEFCVETFSDIAFKEAFEDKVEKRRRRCTIM